MKYSQAQYEDAFWSKVDRRSQGECWPWMAYLDPCGYGRFGASNRGRTVLAHRIAFELSGGVIPIGHECMHSCDNPKCCNPSHLSAGTHVENMRDSVRKGRATSAKGSKHRNAKFTEDEVMKIRNSSESEAELSKRYSVSAHCINSIIHRRTWKHI